MGETVYEITPGAWLGDMHGKLGLFSLYPGEIVTVLLLLGSCQQYCVWLVLCVDHLLRDLVSLFGTCFSCRRAVSTVELTGSMFANFFSSSFLLY